MKQGRFVFAVLEMMRILRNQPLMYQQLKITLLVPPTVS